MFGENAGIYLLSTNVSREQGAINWRRATNLYTLIVTLYLPQFIAIYLASQLLSLRAGRRPLVPQIGRLDVLRAFHRIR